MIGKKQMAALMILAVIFQTGCATVFNERHQVINVDSDPKGAEVKSNMLHRPATTPTTFSFDKTGTPEVQVRIEKEGYVPQEMVLKKSVTPSFFANLLLFGAFWIGGAVDIITGAMWNYQPEVFMKLEPAQDPTKTAAAGSKDEK